MTGSYPARGEPSDWIVRYKYIIINLCHNKLSFPKFSYQTLLIIYPYSRFVKSFFQKNQKAAPNGAASNNTFMKPFSSHCHYDA